jgi:hypothetical protein
MVIQLGIHPAHIDQRHALVEQIVGGAGNVEQLLVKLQRPIVAGLVPLRLGQRVERMNPHVVFEILLRQQRADQRLALVVALSTHRDIALVEREPVQMASLPWIARAHSRHIAGDRAPLFARQQQKKQLPQMIQTLVGGRVVAVHLPKKIVQRLHMQMQLVERTLLAELRQHIRLNFGS